MKIISYDTETTGLFWSLGDEMFAFSTCDYDGNVTVQRIDGGDVRRAIGIERLETIWSDTETAKVLHNAKFDLAFTEKCLGHPVAFSCEIHDTLVMSKLLFRSLSHGLKELCWEMFGFPTDDEEAVSRYAAGRNYQTVPEAIMTRYQGRDAERTMLLFRALYPELLKEPKLLELYNMEIELIKHTLRSEQRGVRYNKVEAVKLKAELRLAMEEAQKEIARITGRVINPESSVDVANVLYNILKLPVIKLTKEKKPSTDLEVLNYYRLRDVPVAAPIMKYRACSHGLSAMNNYERFCDASGHIHPTINTVQAVTGRESCSNPNLQNIAKEETGKNPYSFPARRLFIPDKGYVNLHIDFAGIEIRLIAHCSRDENLILTIRSGQDPHIKAAALFYGPLFKYIVEMGDKEKLATVRHAAKQGQYAIAYGASSKKLSIVLGLTPSEGEAAAKAYKGEYSGVGKFASDCIRQVWRNGYIETEFGRRVYCDKNQAYRAPNYKVQGTAADILKMAYTRVAAYLLAETNGEAEILLPVHDELVIAWPRSRLGDLDRCLVDIEALMTHFENLTVPMDIEVKLATTCWADAKAYNFKGKT